MDNTYVFPDDNIDPKKKGYQWCLQFCQAAWNDAYHVQPRTMFYHYAREYDRIMTYAHGRQDTTQYKKVHRVDEQSNTTFAVLDFKILPIVKKHRQNALGRLQKSEYNIVATAIDAQARDERDQFFNQLMAKLMLRQHIQQQNPELAQAPALQMQAGDPLDIEELQMRMQYGYKNAYATMVEEGIQMVFNQNQIDRYRQRVFKDLFDFGVAVTKDWMEPSGKVRFRNCDVRSIITNFCRYEDFSDMWYCGEVVDLTWQQFREQSAGQFNSQQYEEIRNAMKSNLQNVSNMDTSRRNDRGKLRVLDIEWLSVDEQVYEDRVNRLGNPVFGKARFTDENNVKDKFKRYPLQRVYRAKWIIGTNFLFDFGLAPYQKRDKGLTNTELSYHIVATNFYEMKASGIMEDIMPIADQIQISWLKMQNIRNQLVPFGWDLDLDAIEEVAFGKGGEQMSPYQVVQMFFQNGILINRRKGLSGNNMSNYKSIEFIQTNYGVLIEAAWSDFSQHVQLLSSATGFNEVTDGSTPNPKNLNSTNAAAVESTNNSLFHIQAAEETLLKKLANAVLKRLIRAVKMGKVEGVVSALGSGNLKTIQLSPDLDIHDYGLMLEDKPSVEQKQLLQQLMAKGMQDGTLDASDMIAIENTWDLKQAEQILAYRIKKRKEQQQQFALQQQQQTGALQIQSAQAAEQAKQQTMALEHQLKLQEIDREKGWDYKIMELQLAVKLGQTVAQIRSTEKMQAKELGIEPEVPMDQTPLPPPQDGQQQQQNPQEEAMEQQGGGTGQGPMAGQMQG